MATLVNVSTKERENKLRELTASGAKSLAGGLQLPEGTHTFTVADKKPFGFLEVESAASGKWILPIVAGSMKVGKEIISFELSAEPGAKTLVIPDNFYLAMISNGQYAVTIESRKGRKVVTNVEPADALKPANADDEE